MSASHQPPEPLRPDLRSEWILDPRISYLNHGSFGAVPRCVYAEQARWQARIDAEPVELLARQGAALLAHAKRDVGQWLGMAEDDFGLVTNATEGVNCVLRSLAFEPGDELLTTSHVYNAVRQAMRFVASMAKAHYREVELPLPVASPGQIVETVAGALSSRTRLLVIDHITSPTALLFPVERIAEECARRGIDILIDGAHAPGMLPLDVPRTGATYYSGNLHKWACAPRGSGFLWVRPDRQAAIHPLVISHDLGKGFAREFAWQGTRDISGWLSVGRAIRFMSDLGWDTVRQHNHELAVWAHRMLCESWDVQPISPISGCMLGSMATLPLPLSLGNLNDEQTAGLQQRLYSEHQIEVPVMRWGGRNYIRPCCQVYNHAAEYERLAQVIEQIAGA